MKPEGVLERPLRPSGSRSAGKFEGPSGGVHFSWLLLLYPRAYIHAKEVTRPERAEQKNQGVSTLEKCRHNIGSNVLTPLFHLIRNRTIKHV